MNLRTALYPEHEKLKAKFCPFAGYDMPVQYTSVKEEALAVRHDVGMFDVSHMGEFLVEGKDTIALLDALLPNDMSSPSIGKAIYSPLCREDGTIIDDLIVYKLTSDKALICVNAANIKKDWTWISQVADKKKFSDLKVRDLSSDYSLIALQGPRSEVILAEVYPEIKELQYYSVIQIKDAIIARTGYTGEDGFEIFASHQRITELWVQLLNQGVTPCGLASRDVLRLEVGFPLYGHELNDEVTPYESGLKWTVKLNKDFIGKVALLESKPQFKLIKLILEKGIPREGYPVFVNDQKVGVVTSGTQSVVLQQGIAIARVKLEVESENYNIQIRNKFYPAQKITGSFVKGGHK